MGKIIRVISFAWLLGFSSLCFGLDKLIVLLDWFPNPNHAPLFVAEAQGFFRQQGLEVSLLGPADPNDPPKLVAAGKADIAITYEPQYLQQIHQGLPLQRIGTLINQPLSCLAVLEDSPIKKLEDLKGKRIGLSTDSMSNITLKTMLKHHGLTLQDVETIDIHYDLTQALLSGKVDAVSGMMRNFEVTQLALVGHPARVFYPEDNGMPKYAELIFVVNKQQAQDWRFKRFLGAVALGERYLQQHPEESWKVFAKAHPEIDNTLNHRAWQETLKYFAKDPQEMDKKESQELARFIM